MKRALVTGGSGFVGRYMIEALDARGFEVWNIDLKEGIDCRNFFKDNYTRFDLVVHLAAIVGGRMKIEGDPLSVATDLAIDSDMFNWAVRTKQPHVIYYSSSAAYPIELQNGDYARAGHRLRERDINLANIESPDFTYGWAKLTGEYLAQFARREGVRVDVFRPFSGYGTDQDLDYPFPSFIKRALAKEAPFKIWGTGKQVRDWIHISDVVEGTLQWAEETFQSEGVTVNLCTGRATQFTDLAGMVMKAAGYVADVKTEPDKPQGVLHRVGSPVYMREVYAPRITLEHGISMAMRGQR